MEFSQKDLENIIERASTIAERIGDGFLYKDLEKSDELALCRLNEWCQIVAQGDWTKFQKRLTWDGLDKNIACSILTHVHLSNNLAFPSWANTLNEVIQAISFFSTERLRNDFIKENCILNPKEPLPFEEVFLPFIYVARQKLTYQTDSSYYLLSKEAHISLERNLLLWLTHLCSQSMELEFSAFRVTRQSTLVRLLQKSSDDHFKQNYRHFIESLLAGKLLAFFQEYSVLARLVATVTDFWVDATQEFILRLKYDWSEIQETFANETEEIELGQVVAIQPSFSDRHHNGRSVMIITFKSGLRLIYKPKNLGLEKAYFNLLSWFNKHEVFFPFKLLKVVDRSTYGWVEYVTPLPCQDKQEAKRYYQRAGMLLCIIYALEGTDCHFENIISCGEHPVLIDMETLMHHRVKEVTEQGNVPSAQYLASQQLGNSVFRTGLLPQWEFGPEGQSYDFSGLGVSGEQDTPFLILSWNNINEDSMTLRYKYATSQSPDNAPSLENVNLLPRDYVEEIIDGFRQMYRFFMEHREAILAPGCPLGAFTNQQVRFVFRSTKIYRSVLNKTLNPKYLREGVDRSIQLDVLSRAMLSSESKPIFWPLLRAEQQALEQIDIPLFTSYSDSDALIVDVNEIIDECFTASSYELVTSRLNKLNDEDLEKQIYFIKGSLYASVAEQADQLLLHENSDLIFDVVAPLTRKEIVKQANVIAANLQKQAINSNEGSTTWLALQRIIKREQYQFQVMGYGLYDGCCGVVLFLTALEKVTGEVKFRDLALASLQPLRNPLLSSVFNHKIVQAMGIGGSLGLGSILYSLVCISQFLEDTVLVKDTKKIASLITPNLIATDQMFDVSSGAAGAILGLLALYKVSADSEVLEKAIICGHHLINHSVATNTGHKAWPTIDRKFLTGLSHGAAGIAYALLRLYQVTDEVVFRQAAQEAIAYEHSVFITEEGNWPDFRGSSTKDRSVCMCSWCHGAPGIGLARVAGLDILDTPEIRQDVEVAINTTKQHKLSGMDHLCCGNLGRVEFLFTAGRKLSRPDLVEEAMKQAAQVVALAQQRGHFSYGSILDFHPGFFQGAAGIGYQLLRLAYPDQLPSVLLWE
jgi:type 2 lantibiotic biosynthesis protein LanM